MSIKINSKSELRSPKAVIFDTDNTLYLYDKPHKEAMSAVQIKACDLLGVTKQDFNNAFNEARSNIKQHLGNTASSHSRLLYFQRTIELLNLKTQCLTTLDLEQTYWRTFLSNSTPFSGVEKFIKMLKELEIETAIVTDLTSQIQFRKIIYFGFDTYFDYVVTSEESGNDKPHRSAFVAALDKLKIEPEDIWIIGDDLEKDIRGGNSINMTTFQKINKWHDDSNDNTVADVVFTDYEQLIDFINKRGIL